MAPPKAINWIWRFFNDLRSVGGTGTSSVSRGFFAAVTSLMVVLLFSCVSVVVTIMPVPPFPAWTNAHDCNDRDCRAMKPNPVMRRIYRSTDAEHEKLGGGAVFGALQKRWKQCARQAWRAGLIIMEIQGLYKQGACMRDFVPVPLYNGVNGNRGCIRY